MRIYVLTAARNKYGNSVRYFISDSGPKAWRAACNYLGYNPRMIRYISDDKDFDVIWSHPYSGRVGTMERMPYIPSDKEIESYTKSHRIQVVL